MSDFFNLRKLDQKKKRTFIDTTYSLRSPFDLKDDEEEKSVPESSFFNLHPISNPIPTPVFNPKSQSIGTGLLDALSIPLHSSVRFFDTTADQGGSIFDFIGEVITGKFGQAMDTGIKFIKSLPEAIFNVGEEIAGGISLATEGITEGFKESAKTGFTGPGPSGIGSIGISNQPLQTQAQQQTFSDYIRQHHPDFAKDNKVATSVLGFVGDVALDPTTYVSFGTASAIKIAGKRLSNEGIDVVRGLNQLAEDGFRVTISGKNNQTHHVVDFGVDQIQALQQVKNYAPIVSNIEKAIDGETAALKQLSLSLQPYLKNAQKGKIISIERLDDVSRQLSVEDSFINLTRKQPNLIQEGGELGLFLDIPFTPKRITVIPPAKIDAVFDAMGLSKIRQSISSNLKQAPIAMAFNRDLNVNDFPEYKEIRDTLYGNQNRVDHNIIAVARQLGTLPDVSKTKLTDLAIKLETVLQTKLDAKLTSGQFMGLTSKEISTTRNYWINQAKLSPEEFNVFTKYISVNNQLAEVEMTSQLYKEAVTHAKPLVLSKERLGAATYDAIQNQIKAQNTSQIDIAILTALRMKDTMYKESSRQFDSSLETLFGVMQPNGKIKVDIPIQLQKDIDQIGTSTYSQKGQQMVGPVLKAVHKFNSLWKTLAYGVKFYSGPKQHIGNTLQSFSKLGAPALKALDPRAIIDATLLMSDNSAYAKYIPSFITEGMFKIATDTGKILHAVNRFEPDLLQDMVLTTRLGDKIHGKTIYDEVINKDIYQKQLDVLEFNKEKNLQLAVAKQNGFSSFQRAKWEAGFLTFMKESIPWINLPSHIENMNRVATHVNARKMGYLPDQAATKTKEALFDYAHGLTEFENKWMRALVPFYTFNRFAIPLGLSLIKEPGKASVLSKTMKEFFEVYTQISSGEQLTESQRQVLPGFLLEQPSAFDGYTVEGERQKGIFRTFNSYNFTDWLSLIQTDIEGNIDLKGTFQKMTLAQITPVLKVPIEILADKNFFTDTPISKGGKVASGEAVARFEQNVPDIVKQLISYEQRTDLMTGEKRGYINPYITYLSTSFAPFLTDYVAINRDDLNARDFAMKFLVGVGTVKLDFQKEQHYRIREWQEEIKELQREIRNASLAGRSDIVNKDQAKLQEVIKKIDVISKLQVK